MADDNVPIEGLGASAYQVATDRISGRDFQWIKIASRIDGDDTADDQPTGSRQQTMLDALVAMSSVTGDIATLAGLSQDKGSAVSAYMPGMLAVVQRDNELSTLPESEATATTLRVDEFGRLWIVDGGAMSAYVDSVRTVKGVPDGATPFHIHYSDSSSRAAASAYTVFDPPSGTITVVTDILISTSGTTGGKLIFFFAADADNTYTQGTDVPIEVASFLPSTTQAPGVVDKPETQPTALAINNQIKYQNTAAVTVDAIFRGYTYTP